MNRQEEKQWLQRLKGKGRTKTKSCSGRREISKAKAHFSHISCGSLITKAVQQTAQNNRAKEPTDGRLSWRAPQWEPVLPQSLLGSVRSAASSLTLWPARDEHSAHHSRYQESKEKPLLGCPVPQGRDPWTRKGQGGRPGAPCT